ncbi:MAG: nucleoside-diphosphate sugar epimerase/dehydratase [Gemmatimonadales bacterium]
MQVVIRNRILLVADIAGALALPAVALWFRLGDYHLIGTYGAQLAAYAWLALMVKFTAFWLAGIYRRYWRYASIDELLMIHGAAFSAAIVATPAYYIAVAPLIGGPRLPFSVPLLDLLLTIGYTGLVRFSPRLVEHVAQKLRGRTVRDRVLIVGAGDAGTMIARELRANRFADIEPVGFIDDNRAKHENVIHGLPVLGGRESIPEVARDYGVNKVIIAMPRVAGHEIRAIRDICDRARLATKIVPNFADIISGRVSISQLRDVDIEDLLRRKPVETDQKAVGDLLSGVTVLVTGAGGSIGGELCRQIAGLGIRELVLLGHGENSIFDIHQELKTKHPGLRLVPAIANVRDPARIRRVFETFRPVAVFHAAAHKHVPLMEWNPDEAVTNNLLGTRNVLEAAEATGTKHFVLISTDKAVNPANVMGATKLLAETLVHEAAVRSSRAYVSVRFGNVLASRGSVVPAFRKQIAAGGPVTVTHPDITRYFMTIPEAVQLVLQAAALGSSGETYVLDMGEPVKISDLAKDLIRLSGLEVDKDISIVYSGLRPGEKLYEELFNEGEEVSRTAHDKIFMVRNGRPSVAQRQRIPELLQAAQAGDAIRIRHLLQEIVPGYKEASMSPPDARASDPGLAARQERVARS